MRRIVLLLSIQLGALGAAAQNPSSDYQAVQHVFPQFVDGTSGDRAYVSTVQVSAADWSSSTQCTLGLMSMPALTLSDARGTKQTGTIFNFVLAPAGWQILQTVAARSLQSGSAILNCTRPVSAHLIYTATQGSGVSSEASLLAAPPGLSVQILADQRKDARVGIAIANPFNFTAAYRISLFNVDGRLVGSSVIQIASTRSYSRFLNEVMSVPVDFRGPVIIESLSGFDVYAAGLRFSRESFTGVPATVRWR